MNHGRHGNRPRKSCKACLKQLRGVLLHWAERNRRSFPWRRPGKSPYELVVAEVLLQQTRAESVAKILPAVLRRCPDWPALAAVPVSELEGLLRPLGLHRRRAAALHDLASIVAEEGLPDEASGLENLPGIGQYMARAIAVQLSGEVAAPIDTNVARVLERVFGPRKLADIRYDSGLQRLGLSLVPPSNPGGYLTAILDFAALVCRPRLPMCGECPVAACRFRSSKAGLPSTKATIVS